MNKPTAKPSNDYKFLEMIKNTKEADQLLDAIDELKEYAPIEKYSIKELAIAGKLKIA